MSLIGRARRAAWRAPWFHRVRNEIIRYLHLDKLDTRVADLEVALADASALATATARTLDDVVVVQQRHVEALDRVDLLESLLTFMAWIGQHEQPESLLVSVVTPTHNRCDRLLQAMASVRAQSYGNWEHVIVDDGSIDGTPELMANVRDPRVTTLRIDHGGPAAARNAALDIATGDVVVYLDDDNRFHPDWLKAVVWAFETHPSVDVACGARLIDDHELAVYRRSGGLPRVQYERFDRATLEQFNTADMGMLAHRAKLGIRFDERLWCLADWDLYLRLTEEGPAFSLPALALVYTTDADSRISAHPDWEHERLMVREKLEAPTDDPRARPR